MCKGTKHGYTTWHCHGENGESDDESEIDSEPRDTQKDDMHNLIKEAYLQEPNSYAKEFYNLPEKCEKPLYPICDKFSNILFLVK